MCHHTEITTDAVTGSHSEPTPEPAMKGTP
jgi:hypothetical protein